MLDFPAFATELWAGFDAGDLPRPEYVLPVLWVESNFNPGAINSIGCVGINQACPFAVPTPPDYRSWPASEQLRRVVRPMYAAMTHNARKYGTIGSGTRAYQANFLPATLATATSLDSVLAMKGSKVYAANAWFDYRHTGAIRVSDLAHAVSVSASTSAVQSAIAQSYAQRPSDSPRDPVYGTDFSSGGGGGAIATLFEVGALAFLGWAVARELRLGKRRHARA